MHEENDCYKCQIGWYITNKWDEHIMVSKVHLNGLFRTDLKIKHFLKTFQNQINIFKDQFIIIVGDFNT